MNLSAQRPIDHMQSEPASAKSALSPQHVASFVLDVLAYEHVKGGMSPIGERLLRNLTISGLADDVTARKEISRREDLFRKSEYPRFKEWDVDRMATTRSLAQFMERKESEALRLIDSLRSHSLHRRSSAEPSV